MESADRALLSLSAVIAGLAGSIVVSGAAVFLLLKPQLEVGRAGATRGKGVVGEPELRLGTVHNAASSLLGAGAVIMDAMRSPVTGASGNTEPFVDVCALAGAAGPGTARAFHDAVEQILRRALATAPR
jgi:predicted rRNA methylase YqxC with S4 and FtsJ domains